jgi:hypothetical protein
MSGFTNRTTSCSQNELTQPLRRGHTVAALPEYQLASIDGMTPNDIKYVQPVYPLSSESRK